VNYSIIISVSLPIIISVLNSYIGFITGNIGMKREEMSKCISIVIGSMVVRVVSITILVGIALTIEYFNHLVMMITLVVGIFVSQMVEVFLLHFSFERRKKIQKTEKKNDFQ